MSNPYLTKEVYKVIPWSNVFKNMAFAIIDTNDPSTPLEYGYPQDINALELKTAKLNERVRLAYNRGAKDTFKEMESEVKKAQEETSEDRYTFQFKPGIIEMVDALADATKAYLKMTGVMDHMNEIQKKLGFEGPSFTEHMRDRDTIRSATVMSAIEFLYKQWQEAGVIK